MLFTIDCCILRLINWIDSEIFIMHRYSSWIDSESRIEQQMPL